MSEDLQTYDEEAVPVSGLYRIVNRPEPDLVERMAKKLQSNIECYEFITEVCESMRQMGIDLSPRVVDLYMWDIIDYLRYRIQKHAKGKSPQEVDPIQIQELNDNLDAAENLLVINPVTAKSLAELFQQIHAKARNMSRFIKKSGYIAEPEIALDGSISPEAMEESFEEMERNLIRIELQSSLEKIGIFL